MEALSFYQRAERDPGRVALVGPDESPVKAGALLDEVNQMTAGLQDLGLQRGDGIACVLPNDRTFITLYLAAMQAGLYLTPINWHLTPSEIAYILADSGATALVIAERFQKEGARAADEVSLPSERRLAAGRVSGFRSVEELWDGKQPSVSEVRDAGQLMLYTSGTTGRPKGVRRPLPERDADTVATEWGAFGALFEIEGPGVHLVTAPLYHAANIGFAAGALHQGRTLVLMDRWSPEAMLDLVRRHHVTSTHMVPTMFHRLLRLPKRQREAADVTSLRSVVHAAAPCPVELKRAMLSWWGPVIYEYYAATEGGGTYVTPAEWLKRPGTVGRPWPGADVRVLDESGQRCSVRVPGLVYFKLKAGGVEYFGDPAKTRDRVRDGYITAGDIGYLDEDGWLFLCDRQADVIISGGVNIYPAEIEGAILGHGSVTDVAVIGVPDDEWGERVHAIVTLQDDHGLQDPSKVLNDHCRAVLASFKRPRTFEFRTVLPRDPSGKLLRRRLRDEYWAGRTTRI